mgnify:CR=1 FL=1
MLFRSNGHDWWVARNDVPVRNSETADQQATLYFSDAHERWVLEAPDVQFQLVELQRSHRSTELSQYFGSEQNWVQRKRGLTSEVVLIIECFDTRHPTEEPTEQPTEEPTEQPSEQPSEEPTEQPTEEPTEQPSEGPTEQPSQNPTEQQIGRAHV